MFYTFFLFVFLVLLHFIFSYYLTFLIKFRYFIITFWVFAIFSLNDDYIATITSFYFKSVNNLSIFIISIAFFVLPSPFGRVFLCSAYIFMFFELFICLFFCLLRFSSNVIVFNPFSMPFFCSFFPFYLLLLPLICYIPFCLLYFAFISLFGLMFALALPIMLAIKKFNL